MMSKSEAIKYVKRHQAGEMVDLVKAIGEDRVEEFEYLGYIRSGMSMKSETYHSTSTFMEDYRSFYRRTGLLAWAANVIFGLMSGHLKER